LYNWSITDKADYWTKAIEVIGIQFVQKYSRILGDPQNVKAPGWLDGAKFNITDSCFTANPEKPAIVYADESNPEVKTITYSELLQLVNHVANGLHENGFSSGQGIALYMPMNVECVAAYLGVIKAGCHVISIADSYSSEELKRRIGIARGSGVITVDSYQRGGKSVALYEKVIKADAPRTIVIKKNKENEVPLRKDDLLWNEFLSDNTDFESVIPGLSDPINILFSSGTTSEPKAIPWTNISTIKAISDGYFHHDIQEKDVVAWPTNIGWMMGPWLVFAILANNATIALFNGAPHKTEFIDFVRDSRISILGTIPSLVRAWRSILGSKTGFWPDVRLFSSTGEPSNAEDYLWLMATTNYKAPVIEYCGGTELSGGYITGSIVQPASSATFTTPALGMEICIMDEKEKEVPVGETGEIYIVPPSIGLSEYLLNKDHNKVYYEDCPVGKNRVILRRHGDFLTKLHQGFYKAQGRSDDSMNLGGIKISALELEQVINSHKLVYENAAISVQPEGAATEKLIVYIVPESEIETDNLIKELNAMLAEKLNPLFRIFRLIVIDKLPRTASNKIMHRLLRDQYTSDELNKV